MIALISLIVAHRLLKTHGRVERTVMGMKVLQFLSQFG
jgi:hypothetical protein